MLKKTSLSMVLVFLVVFSGVVKADNIFLGPDSFQRYEISSGDWDDVQRFSSSITVQGDSPNYWLYAPIQLPEGAKITSMVIFYYDDNNSSEIRVEIIRENRYGKSQQTIIPEWTSDESTTDPQITKRTNVNWTYNKILNGSCTFHVKLTFYWFGGMPPIDWNDLRFYGLKIFYMPPTS